MLNYQARITSATGTPVADGSLSIKFTIYDASASGTCRYTTRGTCGTPTAKTVAVTNGVFSTLLGDTAAGDNAIPDDLFDTPTLYLGITVATDSEMVPRKRLSAAPWAFNADRLDNLDTSATGGTQAFIPVTSATGSLTLSAGLNVAGTGSFGNLIVTGTCTGCGGSGSVNLNQAYNNSTSTGAFAEIYITPSLGAVTIADTFSGTGNILELQDRTNSAGNYSRRYLTVSATSTNLRSNFNGNVVAQSGLDVFTVTDAAGVLRTNLRSGGIQTWYLNDGAGAEVGRIGFATPTGVVGFAFADTSANGRSDFRHLGSAGGFAWAAHAASGIPPELMRLTSGGNLGIGNAAPANRLTVGNATATFEVNAGGNIVRINAVAYSWPSTQGGASTVLTNNGSGVLTWAAAGGASTTLQQAYDNDVNGSDVTITTNATDGQLIFAGDQNFRYSGTGDVNFDTDTFVVDSSANRVGIGTNAPAAPLEVRSGTVGILVDNNANAFSSIDIDSGGAAADFSVLRFFDRAANKWELRKNSANNFDIRDAANAIAPFTIEAAAPTDSLYIRTATGNVGLGTSTASEKLEVVGNAKVGVITVGATAANFVNLDTNNDGSVLLSSNISGGNCAPGSVLTTSQSHAALSGAGINIPANGCTRQGNIEFWTTPVGGVTAGAAYPQSSPRMVIDNDGDVGIGNTAPANRLTVGNATSTFEVNQSGNLVKINNVTYSWPASQGFPSTVLTNNGSGGLSWSAAGGGATLQSAYDSSTGTTEIFLGAARGALTLADSFSSFNGNLFEIQDRVNATGDYSRRYFTVSSTNTSIGSASNTYAITPNARIAGNLTPTTDAAFDLGDYNRRWRDLWLSGGSANIAYDTSGTSILKLSFESSNGVRGVVKTPDTIPLQLHSGNGVSSNVTLTSVGTTATNRVAGPVLSASRIYDYEENGDLYGQPVTSAVLDLKSLVDNGMSSNNHGDLIRGSYATTGGYTQTFSVNVDGTINTEGGVFANGSLGVAGTGYFTGTLSADGGLVVNNGMNVTGDATIDNLTVTGTCTGCGGGTLQSAYDGSTSPELTVDSTRGALTIRDADPSIGGNLFEVKDSSLNTSYLTTSSTATTIASNFTVTKDTIVAINSGVATGNGDPYFLMQSTDTGGGNLIAVSDSGATSAGHNTLSMTTSTSAGKGISLGASLLTTGVALNITSGGTGLTSGSLIFASTATTGALATNGAISFNATGNYTSTSNVGLLNLAANTTTAGTVQNIQANALTTGDALRVASTGAGMTTGSLLKVETGTTGAVATDGIVSLNATGNYTSTSNVGLLNVTANSTQAGTIQNISGNALTTGVALNITGNGAYTGTGMFAVTGNSTVTGTLASISSTAAMTGTGRLLNLVANSASTTTAVAAISATGLSTGSAFTVTGGGANMTVPNARMVDFNMGAALRGSALRVTGSGRYDEFQEAMVNIENTNTTTMTGQLLRVATGFVTNDTDGASNGFVRFQFQSGRNTGIGFQIVDFARGGATSFRQNANNITTGLGYQLNVSGLTTGTGLDISGGSSTVTESLLKVGNAGQFTVSASGTVKLTLDRASIANANEAVCHNGSDTALTRVLLMDCINAPAADYMEMYPAAPGLEMGDIVMPGTVMVGASNGSIIPQVVKTTAAYEGSTIGIISNPKDAGDFNSIGYNIRPSDNPQPVALVGRVLVKVNTENGPINIGDPVTSSSVAGVGMKSTGSGMVVGTALSGWEGPGQGTILIFINVGWRSGDGRLEGTPAAIPIPAPHDAPAGLTPSASGTPSLAAVASLVSTDGLWGITSEGLLTARKVETDVLETGKIMMVQSATATSISEGVVPKGKTSVTIKNAAMLKDAKVFVSFLADSNGNSWITDKADGSFTLRLKTAPKKDLPFEYWIISVDDQRPKQAPAAK